MPLRWLDLSGKSRSLCPGSSFIRKTNVAICQERYEWRDDPPGSSVPSLPTTRPNARPSEVIMPRIRSALAFLAAGPAHPAAMLLLTLLIAVFTTPGYAADDHMKFVQKGRAESEQLWRRGFRSEERRVGKEWRVEWGGAQE